MYQSNLANLAEMEVWTVLVSVETGEFNIVREVLWLVSTLAATSDIVSWRRMWRPGCKGCMLQWSWWPLRQQQMACVQVETDWALWTSSVRTVILLSWKVCMLPCVDACASLHVIRPCVIAVPFRIGETYFKIQDLKLALHAASTISQPKLEVWIRPCDVISWQLLMELSLTSFIRWVGHGGPFERGTYAISTASH